MISEPIYDRDADRVVFFSEDTGEYFAEYVNAHMSVYRAFSDKRIIGFEINGVSGKIRLSSLLRTAYDLSEMNWVKFEGKLWDIAGSKIVRFDK